MKYPDINKTTIKSRFPIYEGTDINYNIIPYGLYLLYIIFFFFFPRQIPNAYAYQPTRQKRLA